MTRARPNREGSRPRPETIELRNEVTAKSVTRKMKARLYNKYVNEVVPALKEKHKYTNVHQIPRMDEDRGEHGHQRVAGKKRD